MANEPLSMLDSEPLCVRASAISCNAALFAHVLQVPHKLPQDMLTFACLMGWPALPGKGVLSRADAKSFLRSGCLVISVAWTGPS